MPFYLTSLVDAKLPQRQRRPIGWDRVTGYSLIRPNGSDAPVICWMDRDVLDPGVVLIGQDKDEALSSSASKALADFINDGRTWPATLGAAIADTMIRSADGSAKLATTKDGMQEVLLGPNLLSSKQVSAPRKASVQFTDNFNRTAGNLNGSTFSGGGNTWVENANTTLVTNGTQATVPAGPGASAVAAATTTVDLDTADMIVQADVVSQTQVSGYTNAGVLARGSGVDSAGANHGYACGIENSGGNLNMFFFDYSDQVAFSSLAVGVATGTIKFVLNGSSLQGYLNGVLKISGTDSTSSTKRGGITGYVDGTSDSLVWDNFVIQDLGFGAGRTTKNTRAAPLGVNVGMGWRM